MKLRMKEVEVLQPFNRNCLPFLMPLYNILKKEGYMVKERVPLFKGLYALSYRFPLNVSINNIVKKQPAYLLFMSAIHSRASLFPYAYTHEIIPVIWDCWPDYRQNIERMFRYCYVKIAFFSSSQTADYFMSKYPAIKIYFLPEVFDKSLYYKGTELSKRTIDVIEYGRSSCLIKSQLEKLLCNGRHILFPKDGQHLFDSFDNLAHAIADSKVVIAYPRSETNPEVAQGVETLTQRYWEGMYSRAIMVGRSPQELVNILGYNPVVECDVAEISDRAEDVLNHLDSYQILVDKNYEASIKYGDFHVRMLTMIKILSNNGYELLKA